MSDGPRCSFCTVKLGASVLLIAGPCDVYICNDCVQLCAEVVVEQRDPAKSGLTTSGAMDRFAAQLKDLDEARAKIRKLEAAVAGVIAAIVPVAGPTRITCMWCAIDLPDEPAAKSHVAVCDRHPAVIALAARDADKAGSR